MSDDDKIEHGPCGCEGEDTPSWRVIQHQLARFNDRSSTAAANAIDQSVNQNYAQGMAMLELMTGRAAPSVKSNADDVNQQLIGLLGSINQKLDAALAK